MTVDPNLLVVAHTNSDGSITLSPASQFTSVVVPNNGLVEALRAIREEIMNWLPDSGEGDEFKAKLICQIDAAISKAKD